MSTWPYHNVPARSSADLGRLVFAPEAFPVFRFTYTYGIPVDEPNTGKSRAPRSSASYSSCVSPAS
ncbi:MAG TPA: hypothetical protein VHN14_32530 [Kofleriaceae bacterium]|jgi:hypothetical protein|nr:hypothetical protein [Kofleriaceae bacterium]